MAILHIMKPLTPATQIEPNSILDKANKSKIESTIKAAFGVVIVSSYRISTARLSSSKDIADTICALYDKRLVAASLHTMRHTQCHLGLDRLYLRRILCHHNRKATTRENVSI